jgi:3-oxoacyl-[acyl-carrier protein] reductase
MTNTSRVLVFGATGSVGAACVKMLKSDFEVKTAGRDFLEKGVDGKFDAVVWANGKNQTSSFLETSEGDWSMIWDANFNFVRHTLKSLIKSQNLQRPSSLIFLSSVWSLLARENKSAYITSKSALEGLTRALAVELAHLDIRINSILPGIIDNEMTNSVLTQEQLLRVCRETPRKKLVTANEVASVVKFLSSHDSNGITGQALVIDHGWSIARYI